MTAVPDLELEIAGIGCPIELTCLASQPVGMHCLDIPPNGLGASRHRSVDPCTDLDALPGISITRLSSPDRMRRSKSS